MSIRIADAIKKHQLTQRKLTPEGQILEILLNYVSGVDIKHLKIQGDKLVVSGLSSHAKTKILLKKQDIISVFLEKDIAVRDIL